MEFAEQVLVRRGAANGSPIKKPGRGASKGENDLKARLRPTPAKRSSITVATVGLICRQEKTNWAEWWMVIPWNHWPIPDLTATGISNSDRNIISSESANSNEVIDPSFPRIHPSVKRGFRTFTMPKEVNLSTGEVLHIYKYLKLTTVGT